MDNVTKISVNALKIHPKNQEFFDDIEGEQYEIFKKSIIEEGIITPLIIAPDMTVISGHQRLKACKELGIEYIPVIIDDDLQDETLKLKRLIASNFGRLKNNPMKQARVIAEYEKLCGIKHGNNQWTRQNVASTQEDIAKELGIDIRTLQRLKRLQNLIPELQDLVEKGELNWTTAVKIWARLPQEEQQKFIEQIGINNISNMTAKETEQAIEKIKQQLVQEQEKNKELMQKLDELSNRPPEVIEKIIEKIPEDYEKVKAENERKAKQYEELHKEYKKVTDELLAYKHHTETLHQMQEVDLLDIVNFKFTVNRFLKDVTPLVYLGQQFAQLKENDRRKWLEVIETLERNIDDLKAAINGNAGGANIVYINGGNENE